MLFLNAHEIMQALTYQEVMGCVEEALSKSVGMALFDPTTVRLAFAKAFEKGLGTER